MRYSKIGSIILIRVCHGLPENTTASPAAVVIRMNLSRDFEVLEFSKSKNGARFLEFSKSKKMEVVGNFCSILESYCPGVSSPILVWKFASTRAQRSKHCGFGSRAKTRSGLPKYPQKDLIHRSLGSFQAQDSSGWQI